MARARNPACSVPFTNLPPTEAVVAEITRFITAKAEVEVVQEDASKKARAR